MKNKRYLIVLIMTVLATGCGNNDTQQVQDTMAQVDNIQEDQDTQSVETNLANDTEEVEQTEESQSEEKSEEVPTTEATDNTTVTENSNTQEAVLEEETNKTTTVEPISLDGLSTESKGWGQGGNVDENNVPVGCTMYQDQYGNLGADFIRTDSDAVYLTFDEGYEYPEANSATGNTAKILDVLKEKGATGVFFVTLPYAKSNPDLINRMINEGHIIGNHSVNHPSSGLPSLGSVEAQQSELTGVHDYMLENYNYTMDLFRYPTGAFSEQSLAIVHNLGYKSIFWSFAYKDWLTDAQPNKAEALNTMKEKLHPGAIYLLHAVSVTNTEVLADFIDAARAAGYEIKAYQ